MQRADKRKYHYIYKITRDDGRYYIGMHSTDDLEDGYFGSGKKITRSIKKHGKESHHKEILEFLPDRNSLAAREKQIVCEQLLKDAMCMNIAGGGHPSGFFSEQHERNFRAANHIGGSKTIKSNSKAATLKAARIKCEVTTKERGTKFTRGMLGKSHTTKSKALMSEAQSANRNSQYGTCWVSDGVKPIKIRLEKLDEYISNGFTRGRHRSLV